MEPALSAEELARYLAWCLETGQDMAVSEEPADRFATLPDSPAQVASGKRPLPGRPPTAMAVSAPPMAAPEDARVSARDLAAQATSLDALKTAMADFEGCALKGGATQLVFSDGNPAARIMLVGEAPGAEEDRSGRPFVGPAGRLLDRMLKGVGLDRDKVYIANVLPWRPPGNRTPTPLETAICLPFLERQIELVGPDLILCLGASSARALLGVEDGILKARGVWRDWSSERASAKALATLHPAYLLRQPAHKRLAWRDLRLLAKAAATLPPR